MINKIKKIINKRKNKKKKGFTLVELLAVIVILAVIMVITIPTVLGNMNEARQKAFNTVGETMKKYLVDNYNNCRLGNEAIAKFDDEIFDNNCNLITDDLSSNLIKNSGYSTEDINEVDVTFDGRGNFGVSVLPKEDGQFEGMKDETINSVPNAPDLSTGLVPIKYNGENWVVTTSTDPEWFDYANQKWANAASLVSGVSKEPGTLLKVPNGDEMMVEDAAQTDILAMFVWIPRFSYTIGCTSSTSCYGYRIDGASPLESKTPGAIDIKFVGKDTSETYTGDSPTYTYTSESDRKPTNYYTHPAFTFGDDELTGMWVGKFETSVDAESECYKYNNNDYCNNLNQSPRILPNVKSLRWQTVYNQYETAKKFTLNNDVYGLTGDSHMMKNSEWGAVAYLSQSIYGKYGNAEYIGVNKEIYKNDSSKFYTGRSQGLAPITSSYSPAGKYKYNDISTSDGEKEANSGTGASTTGNIYGIYDMSGGAYEYVMAWYTRGSSVFGGKTETFSSSESNSSGFTNETKPEDQHFNGYQSNTIFTKSEEVVGHATYETSGWYSDYNMYLGADRPWVVRGGFCNSAYDSLNAGVFYSFNGIGYPYDYYSFRSILVSI